MAREIKIENWEKLYKCKGCGNFYNRDWFYKNVMWYDLLSSICKDCSNKKSAKWKRDHKDKWNDYQRKYIQERISRMEIYWTTAIQPIPEPTYPQPWPQPIPTPHYPQPEPVPAVVSVNFDNRDIILTPSINKEPVITNNIDTTKTYTAVSKKEAEISNRLTSFTDRVKKEAEELEKEQIDYEKEYPDAYQKIMSDENYSRAFNYNYTEEQKLDALKREQALLNKKKEEFDYKSDLDKMRAMCDSLLEWDEKKRFEQAVSSLSWERQDKFVHRLWKLPTHQFKNNWKNIYDNILELKNWEKKEKDVIL